MEGLAWKSAVIADNGTTSAEVDLGKPYSKLAIFVPLLTSGTLAVHTAMTAGGTYQALSLISNSDADDDPVLLSTSTGAINVTLSPFGWQHLEFVASASQTAGPITIYCAGFD